MIHFSIILPSTPVYSSGFFTAGFGTKYLRVFLSPIKYVHIVISAVLSSVAAFSSLFERTPLIALMELLTVVFTSLIQGADKSLARPGKKEATATEDFDVHISYL
jgi:hypothetical protein